ncbi:transposase [Mesorhizobium sp. M0924]
MRRRATVRIRRPTLSVWRPGESPLPPKPWSGRGRPPSRVGRSDNHKPISAKALAGKFDAETWRTVAWREGINTELNSRFAAVRLGRIQGLQSARGSRRRVAPDRAA